MWIFWRVYPFSGSIYNHRKTTWQSQPQPRISDWLYSDWRAQRNNFLKRKKSQPDAIYTERPKRNIKIAQCASVFEKKERTKERLCIVSKSKTHWLVFLINFILFKFHSQYLRFIFCIQQNLYVCRTVIKIKYTHAHNKQAHAHICVHEFLFWFCCVSHHR